MKIWVTLDGNDKINASGFEQFAPNAFEASSDTYTINDCLLTGTDFQIAIWKAIASIKRGNVVSYADLVKLVGRGSPQAAGTACGKNKIPVIIPCHRVVGKTNPLAFNAGADIKRQLLAEEGVYI
jgi:O-6-methylguanine DNA methyltransferase